MLRTVGLINDLFRQITFGAKPTSSEREGGIPLCSL